MATQTTTQPSAPAVRAVTRPKSRLRKLGVSGVIAETIKYFLLITLAISFCLPFYWMVSSALKDNNQVYTVPPVWVPSPAYWNNFWDAWTLSHLDFTLFTFNTVVKYAIPATIGTLLSSVLVAYSFSRIHWPGRDLLFAAVVSTMMIPYWVTMVPLFIIFKELGWLNTFLPLVVPRFFGNAFFIFMLRQFFLSIPVELSDAARIDGANELQTMFHVILPLSKPALAVVALFTFMDAWNDYLGPLIYVNVDSQWVLALGVEKLRAAVYEVGTSELACPYLMAVSALITLPIFLAFFFAQRTFIEGISLTGLKG
jgi:ABC-type glycerol-3-phosphate transport system permease component